MTLADNRISDPRPVAAPVAAVHQVAPRAQSRRVIYDGLNLALSQGTGIATYARVLAQLAREVGHQVGIVYSTAHTPPKGKLAREIAFFDARRAPIEVSRLKAAIDDAREWLAYRSHVRPARIEFSGTVVARQFAASLPVHENVYGARNLFAKAGNHFAHTGKFVHLAFDARPDIFHCTCPMPLRVKGACNIFTIHDLIPLRLPFTTLDNKRQMLRLLKKIAAKADHIVTVSEHSKRDIVDILGIEESRVTNTYQSVTLPPPSRQPSEAEIADTLAGFYGLELHDYFLFFGAFEPKKNIGRIIDAYLRANVDAPLLIVGGEGWQTDAEQKLLAQIQDTQRTQAGVHKRRIIRMNYVSFETLITLIRGARSVLFPSLYEGFGLPVLEAMSLGTPVITSDVSSIPEVAGDAALLVDPYDTDAIAQAIRTMSADSDLRRELSRRGKAQAGKFSLDVYRERINRLYASLA